MKHLLYNITIGCMLVCMAAACSKEEVETYATSVCNLNFDYENDNVDDSEDVTDDMKSLNYSFVLSAGTDAEVDTVWLTVTTMGYLSDIDRPIAFAQEATGDNDAEPGVHYVAFDDAELTANYYYIPANSASAQIPVVLLRDESLQEGSVTLKIVIQENEYFQVGYPAFSDYTITISDNLSKPTAWDECYMDYYFGTYGSVKHQLMIEWTGNAWDDDYIYSLGTKYTYGGMTYWYADDDDYLEWLDGWFADQLEEANEERLNDPEYGDVYRESDGTAVDFTPLSYY